jgi:hypothetical protein
MKSLVTSLALILAVAHLSSAASLVVAPSKDNTIYAESSSLNNGATLSNGKGVNFFAGDNGSSVARRALVSFDLSAIPAGATIDTVSLQLYATVAAAGAQTVSLYRLTSDWGEGTSVASGNGGGGTSATPGDATWTDAFNLGAAWTTEGGDYVLSSSASTSVSISGVAYTWSSAGLVSDVQAWVNGTASNYGWIVIGNESGAGTAKGFASKDATSNQPQLTITYTVAVPEPATQALALFAVLFLGWNALSQRVSLAKAAQRTGG